MFISSPYLAPELQIAYLLSLFRHLIGVSDLICTKPSAWFPHLQHLILPECPPLGKRTTICPETLSHPRLLFPHNLPSVH